MVWGQQQASQKPVPTEASSAGGELQGHSQTQKQEKSGLSKARAKVSSIFQPGRVAGKQAKDAAKHPQLASEPNATHNGWTVAFEHGGIVREQSGSFDRLLQTRACENAPVVSVAGTNVGKGPEDAWVPPKPAGSPASRGFSLRPPVRNLQKKTAENERDNLKQKNDELATEVETLKQDNKDLRAQIETAESRHSRATPAHGVYAGSEADPVQLQKVANDVKTSLSDLAATVRKLMAPEAKDRCRNGQGITVNRTSHIKFAIQAQLCSLAFEGLWETDDYFYQCLPEYADLEKSQQAHFTRYKHIKSLEPSQVLDTLLVPETGARHEAQELPACGGTNSCTTTCYNVNGGGACNCPDQGLLVDLRTLFCAKYEKLIKTDDIKLLPMAEVSEIELKKDFLRFIINVWLAHRLTLSFEQPAALFKVKSGQKYVPDHMEAANDPEGGEPTVAFMIIPGFRVGKAFIKSVVYLTAPEVAVDQGT